MLKNCVNAVVIFKYFTLFEIPRDTLPLIVFISLEEKEDPCKMGIKK